MLVNPGKPPASTSIVVPSGKATKTLSPWPTSIAVTSSLPELSAGLHGCQHKVKKSPVDSRSGAATQRRWCRITQARTHNESAKVTEIQSGNAAIRQEGSNRTCQVATFSAHTRSSLVAAARGCHIVNIDRKPRGTTNERRG